MSNAATIVELQIGATAMRSAIPTEAPLAERVEFAMRYAREHQDEVFFMSSHIDDDLMMRTALAAVMVTSDENDRDLITRSMQPLRMLSALLSGVPVDVAAIEMTDDLLPLLKLWHASKEPKAD